VSTSDVLFFHGSVVMDVSIREFPVLDEKDFYAKKHNSQSNEYNSNKQRAHLKAFFVVQI